MVKASMSGGGVRGAEEAMTAEAADGLIATSTSRSVRRSPSAIAVQAGCRKSPDLIALRRKLLARALSLLPGPVRRPVADRAYLVLADELAGLVRPDRPGARLAAGANPKRAARSPGRGFLSRSRAAIVTGLPLDGAAYARAIVALAIVLMLLLAALWAVACGGMAA